jgi:sulfatase maturation enzyme AslB (radical SAM superfamily)
MSPEYKEKKEWASPYNEFNSLKLLYFKENLKAIVKGEFLPPITIDTDLTNLCNFDCIWCNAKGFRNEKQTMHTLPREHLIKLADFYKKWGVRSTCIAGGGEPLLNQGFSAFLYQLQKNGIKSGIITNGSLLNEENATAIAECSSWCGVSVDAGSSDVFMKIKNLKDEKMFDLVIKNIENLAKIKNKLNSKVEITYKYLLHPWNAKDIFLAAKLAKSIGVNTFHLRPVCWDNLYEQRHDEAIDFSGVIGEIENEIEKAQELEDSQFKFYSVRHKFGERFKRKINFKKCWATPLLSTFGADGNVHLCFDVRGKKDWILCRHYPDPNEVLKVWGSDRHKKIIESVDINKCPRCTFGPHNEIIEKAIIDDKMFLDFM